LETYQGGEEEDREGEGEGGEGVRDYGNSGRSS